MFPLGLSASHWAHFRERTVQLPLRATAFHRVAHANAADRNSAASVVWQVGANTRAARACMMMVSRMLKAPVFAQLRTSEQLGYLVWSGHFVTGGVLHFFVTVQSDHQTADYLTQRIDACMHAVRGGGIGNCNGNGEAASAAAATSAALSSSAAASSGADRAGSEAGAAQAPAKFTLEATTAEEWETHRASLIKNLYVRIGNYFCCSFHSLVLVLACMCRFFFSGALI